MGLTQYLGSLARRWVLLVLGVVLGGAAAGGYLQLSHPVYSANTQLFVSTTASTDLSTAAAGGTFSQQRTASYVQLVTGRELATMVIADLHLDMSPDRLMGELSAQALAETVIIDVTVNDPSPGQALAIARSVGDEFSELVSQVETPPGATDAPLRVSIVAQPELPTAPSSPNVPLVLAAGLLFGMALGAVAAVVRDRLDTSIRGEDAVAEASGAPVLGLVPDVGAGAAAVLAEPERGSPESEAFQVVRSNLQFVSVDTKPRVLMVTSADQHEGKTTTAIRLSRVLADAGRRVLLVEADVRRPRITRYLDALSGAGLTSVLAEEAQLEDVVQPIGDGRLSVLAAGPTPPNPSELLTSKPMRRFLAQAAQEYDVVLLDAPPLLPVADAGGLAALVDGVLLCVRWAATDRGRLQRARALLDRAQAHTLGAIITFVPRRATGTYRYGYSDVPEDGGTTPRSGRLRRLLRREVRQSATSVPVPRSTAVRPEPSPTH